MSAFFQRFVVLLFVITKGAFNDTIIRHTYLNTHLLKSVSVIFLFGFNPYLLGAILTLVAKTEYQGLKSEEKHCKK